jgi:uncharacterized protein YigA (DUF484 family)
MKNSFRETNSNQEIENRLHSLTQSLLSKQNNLEVITAERNALKLQFEKISVNFELFSFRLFLLLCNFDIQFRINMRN